MYIVRPGGWCRTSGAGPTTPAQPAMTLTAPARLLALAVLVLRQLLLATVTCADCQVCDLSSDSELQGSCVSELGSFTIHITRFDAIAKYNKTSCVGRQVT